MVCLLLLIRPIEPFSSEPPTAKPKFVPECSFSAEREVLDAAASGKFLRDRINVDHKTRNLNESAKLFMKAHTIVVHAGRLPATRLGDKHITVTANIAPSKQNLKYLTKKSSKGGLSGTPSHPHICVSKLVVRHQWQDIEVGATGFDENLGSAVSSSEILLRVTVRNSFQLWCNLQISRHPVIQFAPLLLLATVKQIPLPPTARVSKGFSLGREQATIPPMS